MSSYSLKVPSSLLSTCFFMFRGAARQVPVLCLRLTHPGHHHHHHHHHHHQHHHYHHHHHRYHHHRHYHHNRSIHLSLIIVAMIDCHAPSRGGSSQQWGTSSTPSALCALTVERSKQYDNVVTKTILCGLHCNILRLHSAIF